MMLSLQHEIYDNFHQTKITRNTVYKYMYNHVTVFGSTRITGIAGNFRGLKYSWFNENKNHKLTKYC